MTNPTLYFCVYLHLTNGHLMVNSMRYSNPKVTKLLRKVGAVVVQRDIPFESQEQVATYCDSVASQFNL